MGNEEKSPSTLLQAVKLQSKSDNTSPDCQSPTKKQRRDVMPSSSLESNVDQGADSKEVSKSNVVHNPSSSGNGSCLRPVSSVSTKSTPIAPKPILNSQTFRLAYNGRPISSGSSNDLLLYPELLSADVDPEKFLLSHGVDIFNNEDHRQEFITFCERTLAQSLQESNIAAKFTNNNNNVGLSSCLPRLQPRIMPSQGYQPVQPQPRFINTLATLQSPRQFGTLPATSAVTVNGSMVSRVPSAGFGSFQRPLRQSLQPILPLPAGNGTPQLQQAIPAQYFYYNGQKFVPVQVYNVGKEAVSRS